MLFRVTHIEYGTDDAIVRILLDGHDEDGDRRVISVAVKDPYIFALTDESVPADDVLYYSSIFDTAALERSERDRNTYRSQGDAPS